MFFYCHKKESVKESKKKSWLCQVVLSFMIVNIYLIIKGMIFIIFGISLGLFLIDLFGSVRKLRHASGGGGGRKKFLHTKSLQEGGSRNSKKA